MRILTIHDALDELRLQHETPMPKHSSTAPSHLVVGAALAMAAGAVDSTALAAAGRFASHMSGTTTFAIRASTHGQSSVLWIGAATIVSFVAGAAISGLSLAAHEDHASPTRIRWMLGIEMLLIGSACFWSTWVAHAQLAGGAPKTNLVSAICLFFLAAAMGLQNNLSQRAMSPGSRTTHVTGILTDLGSGLGGLLRGAFTGQQKHLHALRARQAFALFASFAVGGVLAAVFYDRLELRVLLLPLALLAGTAIMADRIGHTV